MEAQNEKQPVNPEAVDAPVQETEESTSPSLSPEDLARELERARKEAARYRTKLREREEAEKAAQEAKRQAEMSAEERAKEAEARAQKALAEAEAKVRAAERKAALVGVVTRPERVLALGGDGDDYWTDDGKPNVDAILRDFPEYTPSQDRPIAPAPQGAPTGRRKRYTREDIAKMTPSEINANWQQIQADLARQ